MKNATFANKTKARIEALPEFAETFRGQINIDLAKTALKANVSPGSLSNILGVTRASVHGWLNGKRISRSHAIDVLLLVQAFKEDLARGILPKTTKEARQSYESFFSSSDFFEKNLTEKLDALKPADLNLERWLLGKD
jgi:predicted transcriptional regulator